MYTKEAPLYFYLILAGIFLGIIILLFLLVMLAQQRRYKKLAAEKINAELNTLEVERIRMAGDLHDDLGPVLTLIKHILQDMENLPPQATVRQVEAIGHIDDIVKKIRDIAKSLMPSSLLRKGVGFAIREFIELTQHEGLEIRFDYDDAAGIQKDRRIQIYRILQEIIHNTTKHARGTELVISIQQEAQQLVIRTRDNGCGFDHRRQGSSGGFGLQIIKSRVKILEGNVALQSLPGQGTSFYISIPLKQ